ncbi:16S rRNA (guanine(966)-N(2))-methyltransferase RsmD [Sporosarcina sp. ANT_H38]|uniref:16S rRNA (guanine(966)-N(2))-methyltransferase RsmD n=1 Tax=Sporosarcina sp. ANT_H38 TaxID=2597358 RepID=UPI0011F3B571|nr:16S rRNA (guanine(966)-N(2))-methyltransferase RsmD [Sporosarcina sp. ANT_H38]KAA0966621.1 16S rRNA (guanine(966)-N(2))-methyltransferase RsmD [Sporosarcina sp. ANT_H38]
MRVVAGTRKGTPLKSLAGTDTRPTSDKVKESVFNIIGPYFDGGIAVELFGGSGSLSLEALSRGIDEAFIFEKNVKACAIIKVNAEKCRFTEELHIQRADAKNAVKFLEAKGKKAKLLFIDPPYAETNFYDLAQDFVEAGLLTENAVIVCEHEKQLELPEAYGTYHKMKSSVYGNSAVSIYEK